MTVGNFSWDAVYRTWERRDIYQMRYTKMYFFDFHPQVPNMSLKNLRMYEKFEHAMTLLLDNHDGI
jgi:hypothetical protein